MTKRSARRRPARLAAYDKPGWQVLVALLLLLLMFAGGVCFSYYRMKSRPPPATQRGSLGTRYQLPTASGGLRRPRANQDAQTG